MVKNSPTANVASSGPAILQHFLVQHLQQQDFDVCCEFLTNGSRSVSYEYITLLQRVSDPEKKMSKNNPISILCVEVSRINNTHYYVIGVVKYCR
jgi:hypothetical protein